MGVGVAGEEVTTDQMNVAKLYRTSKGGLLPWVPGLSGGIVVVWCCLATRCQECGERKPCGSRCRAGHAVFPLIVLLSGTRVLPSGNNSVEWKWRRRRRG